MFWHKLWRRRNFGEDVQGKWTPRARAVLSTAKSLAAPKRRILGSDLLLALEWGDQQVSQVLRRLEIFPSSALGRCAPESWFLGNKLYEKDFDRSVRSLPALAVEESKGMGDSHVGIEHILLALARVGVPGVNLPYEGLKKAWLARMGRS
jgi:hypothetical protein